MARDTLFGVLFMFTLLIEVRWFIIGTNGGLVVGSISSELALSTNSPPKW